MYQVKIKVRANQIVRFPGVCVHCTQPAKAQMGLHKRIGRLTRHIEVPLCQACAHLLARRSSEEAALYKRGLVVSGLLCLLAFIILLIVSPVQLGWGLRFLIALFVSLLVSVLTFRIFGQASLRAMLPEKRAVLQSGQIITFSWRATTFAFMNEAFVERFRTLNEALLMEI